MYNYRPTNNIGSRYYNDTAFPTIKYRIHAACGFITRLNIEIWIMQK